MQRTLFGAGVLVVGALVGVGTALAIETPGQEIPQLRPIDCASNSLNLGEPTYESDAIGTQDPVAHATRYIELTQLSETFGSRVVPVVVEETKQEQVVSLADADKDTIGQLRYTLSESGSGWLLDAVSVCSPKAVK